MQKQIKVSIDPMGNSKVEAMGFNGMSCEAATSSIEKALAGRAGVDVREYKPEFNNPETEDQTQQLGIPTNW